MNRNILTGIVLGTMAVVAWSGAAQAVVSEPYVVPSGMTLDFVVEGENPSLIELTGRAEIVRLSEIAPNVLLVRIHCFSEEPCTGFVES